MYHNLTSTDCLRSLQDLMRRTRSGFEANIDALGDETAPLRASDVVYAFQTTDLSASLVLQTARGPRFISLLHLEGAQISGYETERLFWFVNDALLFNAVAQTPPGVLQLKTMNPRLLAERVVLQTLYIETIAGMGIEILSCEAEFCARLIGGPTEEDRRQLRAINARATEAYAEGKRAAAGRLVRGEETLPLEALFRWPEIPGISELPITDGETFNGIWMTHAYAEQLRNYLALRQAESMTQR